MSEEQVKNENRLLILQQLKLQNTQAIVSNESSLGFVEKMNQLGISLNRNVIQAYVGGPGSVYGIGNTTIRRFDDTSQAARKTRRGMTYDQIFSQQINKNKKSFIDLQNLGAESLTFKIQDFRTTGSFQINGKEVADRETYYGMSRRGTDGGDQINKNGLVDITNQDPWSTNNAASPVNDMIKFGFECINNDKPSDSLFLQFRAYLNGGITDNNQATYNNFKYLGRGEEFFVYQGFTRTVGFSFRLAVEHPQDLVNVYNKLNALVSQVYPDYSKTGNTMRTSLTRVTVGDYMYRMPGFIENVNVTIGQDSTWEIEDGKQVPHYVDVNISFRPIHEEIPKRITTGLQSLRNTILYNNPKPFDNALREAAVGIRQQIARNRANVQ
jgi:hypothetical protein